MALTCIKPMYEQIPTCSPPGIPVQKPIRTADIQNFVAEYGDVMDNRFDNTILSKCETGINIIEKSTDITFMEDRNPIEYNPVPPLVNTRPNRSGADTMAPARRNDGFSMSN